MKKAGAVLAAALALQVPAWAATYTLNAPAYPAAAIANFTPPCTGAGACADFTAAMQQSGSFTTAQPLAPGLNHADILAQIAASYSFSDGLTTYAGSDLNSHLLHAYVTTDAMGAITAVDFLISRWQTASQGNGDPVDLWELDADAWVVHNGVCAHTAAGGCTLLNGSPSSSMSQMYLPLQTGAAWSMSNPVAPAPQSVPVDNPWALGLAAAGVLALARRRAAERRCA